MFIGILSFPPPGAKIQGAGRREAPGTIFFFSTRKERQEIDLPKVVHFDFITDSLFLISFCDSLIPVRCTYFALSIPLPPLPPPPPPPPKKKPISFSVSVAAGVGGVVGKRGKGEERKSALFFEDISVPGNGANHVSIKPLLRETSSKTLLVSESFFILMHSRVSPYANRGGFCACCFTSGREISRRRGMSTEKSRGRSSKAAKRLILCLSFLRR